MSSFVINHFHNASPGIQSSSHDRTAQTAETAQTAQTAQTATVSQPFIIFNWAPLQFFNSSMSSSVACDPIALKSNYGLLRQQSDRWYRAIYIFIAVEII